MNTLSLSRIGLAARPLTGGILFLLISLVVSVSPAQGSTFEERAQQVLDNLNSVAVPSPGGTGKLPYGRAIAALAATDGQSESARNYLANTGYGGEIFFNSILQVRGLYMARDHMTPEQLASILAQASDPANDWNNNGTENHRKMTWSSGYLLAQFFPDAQWRLGSETVDSATLMQHLKGRFAEIGRNEFRAGYSEFLSPNYEIYSVAAFINLYDLAEDPEVRAIAEANLMYRFSLMALGSFEEVVLPPWSRYSGVQSLDISANIQWLTWLYWGHGNVPASTTFDPVLPLVLMALSDWRPPAILDQISHREVEYPYTARMQQTHWQWNPERYVMRTTYQDALFAISSGVFRFIPGAFQLDDSQFAIAWDGGASIRQINAYHPYWRSLAVGEDDWLRPTSPFMQTGHHENTAIMLFDIPAEDPWAGIGQWAGERATDMIPLAQTRFPSHMTYSSEGNWIFLADGPVYVAIRVLKDGWIRDRRIVTGFNVIKSRGTVGERWQSGFIFEVATQERFASIDDFKTAVLANPVEVDWDTMTVSYTDTDGDVLVFEYKPFGDGSLNSWIPDFSVDGVTQVYDANWPGVESPWLNLDDNLFLLKVSEEETYVADWRGTIPQISLASGSLEPPAITVAPVDVTVEQGASASFTVAAEGTEPLSYQWFKDGALLAGATEATLNLTGVSAADAGLYVVEVRNAYGSVRSAGVVLTVEGDPVPDTWAGYPIDANGYVNTGTFLGWIYPDGDYILVFYLDKWIYLPESFVSEQGAWAFIN